VGNARIDLIQNAPRIYRDEVQAISARGRYILFNTSFTTVNTIWGKPEVMIAAAAVGGTYNPQDPAAVADMQKSIDDEVTAINSVRSLIALLKREMPDYRIVVRPHPAEKVETWQQIPDIEIVAKSNASPWILGASLMVHVNSTTGLEAALLGVPCLNMGASDLYVMSSINLVERDPEKAAAAIKDFLTAGEGPLKRFKTPAFDYPKGGAGRIAEKIIALGENLGSPPISTWGAVQRLDHMKDKISVSREEFLARAEPIMSLFAGLRVTVQEMDETMFLLQRQ
jgi:hypothetical protein